MKTCLHLAVQPALSSLPSPCLSSLASVSLFTTSPNGQFHCHNSADLSLLVLQIYNSLTLTASASTYSRDDACCRESPNNNSSIHFIAHILVQTMSANIFIL